MVPFSRRDRLVFGPAYDGRCMRYYDPLRVHRLLSEALQGQPGPIIELARQTGTDPLGQPLPEFNFAERDIARGRLLEACPHAFEMQPFDPEDGSGTLEQDCQNILVAYLTWMDELKNEPAHSPTSSPATEGAHSPAESFAAQWATGSGWASGSIENDSCSGSSGP